MEMRPGYKQTEIGSIPNEWEVKALPEVSWFQEGPGLRNWQFTNAGMKVINVTNLEGGVLNLERTDRHISIAEFNRMYRHFAVDAADIVMASSGNSYSKTAAVREQDLPLVMNTSVIRFKPSQSCDYGFLWAILTSPLFKGQIDLMITGGAQPNFGPYHLNRVLVPTPPLPEQRAIAAALSDLDALLDVLDRLIAKKRDLKQAAMQQLLTGQIRLPGFHGEWSDSPLRRFVKQFVVPMRDKPRRFTGDIPWCRIEDFDGMYLSSSKTGQCVDTDTVREMNLKIYPTGTLLVSCSADLGRCVIVAQPLVSNQTFIGLVLDDDISSNVFFYYLMTSRAEDLNNLSSGTTISYLSREQFEEFIVRVPIDAHEQTAIATVLSDMDAELSALEARREKTRALKQGMMQELLTGRTRLLPIGDGCA
jgi:type I restriction enzyme S subunit